MMERLRQMLRENADMEPGRLFEAFQKAYRGFEQNPLIQTRRVKAVSSWPVDYSKDDVAKMLINPYESETPLRQVSQSLTWTAYPYRKIIKTYQDILTYKWYIAPKYVQKEEFQKPEFLREYTLAHKAVEALDIKAIAHMATGAAGRLGKVFYALRYSADKPRNAMRYAFAQQLPSDWVKITGFNNVSKYTVAFNMMYFLQPGTDWRQFGDLFEPFVYDFYRALKPEKKTVYASLDLDAIRDTENVEAYSQSGTWFYWVYLPPEKVWAFELDDVDRTVMTPFTGLMLAMAQIAQYEQVQLELVQNPLISLVTGEIPYANTTEPFKPDMYKLSIDGELFWRQLFVNLMNDTNTGGVGLYLAPAENIKLQQLQESPSATEVSGKGYSYAVAKSGLSAIIPTTTDNRAGVTQISLLLESQFAKSIYQCAMRMVNRMLKGLNLSYEFEFRMFGSLSEDEKLLKAAKEGMTLGILSDTLIYLALQDRTLLDDLTMSGMVDGLGVMELRKPLSSTYTGDGGRPAEDEVGSEGKEQDIDGGKTTGTVEVPTE